MPTDGVEQFGAALAKDGVAVSVNPETDADGPIVAPRRFCFWFAHFTVPLEVDTHA